MTKQIETWTAKISRSIIGAVVVSVRKCGGKWTPTLEAPVHVREFLNLEAGSAKIDGLTFADVLILKASDDHEGVKHVQVKPFPKRIQKLAGQPMHVLVTFTVKNPHYREPRPRLTVREHG